MAATVYLVTGVMGHLGNTITRMLLERGEQVRGFALAGDNTAEFADTALKVYYGNVCDKASLEPFFENPNNCRLVVLHAAGLISIASKYEDKVHDVNVQGTKNIIDMCIKHNVQKLVYISSVHAIPEQPAGVTMHEVKCFNPDLVRGCYAKTKAEATQLVLDSCNRGLNASVVHPSGLIGPYDYGSGHITKLITDYMSNRLTAIVKGGYDMVDSRDVALAVINCADYAPARECYICSGKYVEISDMITCIHELTGHRNIKTVLPLWFAKLTAPLAELYYKLLKQTPLYTSYSLFTLESNSQFSNEKAKKELRFSPRQLKDTLRDTLEWLRARGRVSY